MAQIPGLPVDEPVEQPKAKPGIFGAAAGSVAELGYDSGQIALGGQELEARLQYAHRQLQAKQAEIAVDQYMNGVYADLAKTTTVEGADEVIRDAQKPDKVSQLLGPYEHDRHLGQMVNLAWQQAQVSLQHDVNTHKAHIITEGTKSADEVNQAKTGMQAVQVAGAGGDEETVKVFEDRYRMGLEAGVRAGVYTPQDIEKKMYEWRQNFMQDLAKAGMDSPDASVRKRTISELKSGGGFYKGLDLTTRNALYDAALAKDEHLKNLAEAADLDAGSAHFNKLTDGWSYDAKVNALSSDKWAKDNGFVDDNGNPNRKLLDKLSEDVDRQHLRQQKIQTDKDSEIVDKHLTEVDSGRLSETQIDKIVRQEGGSPKAANQLKTQLRDTLRMKLELGSLSLQARSLRMQELKETGEVTQKGIWDKIIQTGSLDYDQDVWSHVLNQTMTPSQATEVWSAYNRVLSDPDYKGGEALINASSLPDKEKVKAHNDYTGMYLKNHFTGAQAIDQAQKLIDSGEKAATAGFLDRLKGFFTGGGPIGAAAPRVQAAPPKPPDGAEGTFVGSDGKEYYYDKDHKNLGPVQHD